MTSLNYHCFDLENNTVRLIAELWQQQTSPEGSPTHQETGTVRQAGNKTPGLQNWCTQSTATLSFHLLIW